MPDPLGDTPMIGSPGRACSLLPRSGTCDFLFVREALSPLSYRTRRAIDGTRTHALRLADSDASRYITIAGRTLMVQSDRRDSNSCLLGGSQRCLPLHYDRLQSRQQDEPATNRLQDGCSLTDGAHLHEQMVKN